MNELYVAFKHRHTVVEIKPVNSEQDKRYRILVNLIRADRPRYWRFLCHNCGSFVVELQSFEVLDMTDFYNPKDINNAAIGKHCKGTLPDGLPCPYSYYFSIH